MKKAVKGLNFSKLSYRKTKHLKEPLPRSMKERNVLKRTLESLAKEFEVPLNVAELLIKEDLSCHYHFQRWADRKLMGLWANRLKMMSEATPLRDVSRLPYRKLDLIGATTYPHTEDPVVSAERNQLIVRMAKAYNLPTTSILYGMIAIDTLHHFRSGNWLTQEQMDRLAENERAMLHFSKKRDKEFLSISSRVALKNRVQNLAKKYNLSSAQARTVFNSKSFEKEEERIKRILKQSGARRSLLYYPLAAESLFKKFKTGRRLTEKEILKMFAGMSRMDSAQKSPEYTDTQKEILRRLEGK